MKTWIKVAAGILGGLTIIASLGGFKRGRNNDENRTVSYEPEPEIPDEIFDGNRNYPQRRRDGENSNRGYSIISRNEQNFRNIQSGLTRASDVLGHISVIVSSVIKIFHEDPCIKVTPTTFII